MSSMSNSGNAASTGPSLGIWMRMTRLEQGLSQRELASRSGLSRSYVCDIERGRGAHPSVETLDKLATALGFARVDLLKASGVLDQGNDQRESDEERRMLSVYRDLSDGGRVSVMRFARFLHADEHHWVQPHLLDGVDGGGAGDSRTMRHSGPDRFTQPLFEPESGQPSDA
ncbi:MAG: helix-turn-helix domain-containing protein [Chloroflexota bacterium]|nr:helix-turn-helix domain-containing protein [Chloroflexota bacterium]